MLPDCKCGKSSAGTLHVEQHYFIVLSLIGERPAESSHAHTGAPFSKPLTTTVPRRQLK